MTKHGPPRRRITWEQQFTVSAVEPADRPETRMDALFCAWNLPSTRESA
jgi:hypothetical protein